MRAGWGVLALALLLAAAAPALAAPGTIALRAELPLEVNGPHEASGPGSRFLLEGQDGQVALQLEGDGVAKRVVHRMWGYVNMQDPKLGIVYDDSVTTDPLPLAGRVLTLTERRPEFRLLAYEGDLRLGSGPRDLDLLVGALDSAKTVDYQLERTLLVHLDPPRTEDAFSQQIPAGSLQARANDGQLTSDGPVRLFVTDAVLGLAGPDGQLPILAHFREEQRPGSVYNPLTHTWSGPRDHTEYVQEYLVVELAAGHLDVQYAGLPGSLYADEGLLAVDGTAHLPAATGAVTVTQDGKATRHDLRGDDLDLGGRFTLRAHDVLASPARATVDGDGDLTEVSYAGVAAHYDWTKAVAAASLGALALAALGWLLFHAKALGSAAGGAIAGYARVSGQEVLEHPGRQEVYERVKASPGISFVQLAEQVSFGQSTLNYHLRVLEKNEFIASVKDGRYLRFFDRQAGSYAGHRKHAVSALRNETSAAMARHIRAHPGVVQRDLAAAFGVTASTVNWHVTRLEAAGLVTRARDAHFTRYYVAEGWSQLPAEEVQRQDALAAPVLVA